MIRRSRPGKDLGKEHSRPKEKECKKPEEGTHLARQKQQAEGLEALNEQGSMRHEASEKGRGRVTQDIENHGKEWEFFPNGTRGHGTVLSKGMTSSVWLLDGEWFVGATGDLQELTEG